MKRGLRVRALELGFTDVGIAGVEPTRHRELYERWLAEGHHGEMDYLARNDSRARRYDLERTLEGVRSVVVVTHAYDAAHDATATEHQDRAIVARYARGEDYHDVIVAGLRGLHGWLETTLGHPVAARPYTDTGPILERDLARRAGLGWFGKNTMAIHPRRGSYWFIGCLLVDVDLPPDAPFDADHCGTCTACLDGCPTGALLGRDERGAPIMDARRCISYLTIELRGPIPRTLRQAMGNRVFGCDICQEVCPWNQRFGPSVEPAPEYEVGEGAALDGAELVALAEQLLDLDDPGFRARFRGSPLYRAHREGLLRNVCVALGNWGDSRALPTLSRALRDPAALVRGHAAWALGRVPDPGSAVALASQRRTEVDTWVLSEIEAALA